MSDRLSQNETEAILSAPEGTYADDTIEIAKRQRSKTMPWKVLKSPTPISEEQLVGLANEGWDLRLYVPFGDTLYWYFAGSN